MTNRRGRPARIEGSQSIPTPKGGDPVVLDEPKMLAKEFAHAIAYFRECFPDEWEACRLWPTESGLIHMAEKLKG